MQIRYKFLIPAAAALVVLGIATAVLANLAFSTVMGHRVSAAHVAQIESIRREVELTAGQAMEVASLVASGPAVRDAYRTAGGGDPEDETDPTVQRAREALRIALAPMVAGTEQITGPGTLRLHFHLANGRSLLRQWLPRQALRDGAWADVSDDLRPFRRTVVEVNRTGAPVGGIELGRGGFSIRGVVPVLDEGGRRVGSVEVLRSFGDMLRAQLDRPDTHFAVLMDAAFLEVTTELQDPVSFPLLEGPERTSVVVMVDDPEVVTAQMRHGLLEAGRSVVAHGWSAPYFTSAFPVHDAFGQLVGVVWLATDESELLTAQRWFRRRLTVVTTALVGALSVLLIAVGHRAHAPLRATTARLAAVADGAGDLGVRLEVHGRDEMAELAAQFNRFVHRLQTSLTELTRNTARLEQRIAALPVDGIRPPSDTRPEPSTVRSIDDAIGQTEAIILAVEGSLIAVRRAEEAQRLLAAVVRSSADAIMALDLEGAVLSWNDGGVAMYGHSAEEIVGRPYALLVPEDQLDELRLVLEAVRNGEPLRRIETELRRRDGARFHVSLAVSPIRGGDGGLAGASVIERDISKRKEAELAAELQRKQLVQADRLAALGTLVAGVAHEISNPTAAITVAAPVVRDLWAGITPALDVHQAEHGPVWVGVLPWDVVRDQVPTLLKDIADSAGRIEGIVRSLKDFARRDTAALEEDVDVNRVVRSALALTRNRVQKATFDLAVELAEDLPRVRGNSQRLEQVVVNLLLNACDALERPEQGLRVETGIAAGDGVVIIVTDQGVGIPPELLDRIRDPFFTTKRDSGGTGLGLSISSGIVEDHGGELRLASAPGNGTVATVWLPTAAGQETAP